MVRWLGLDAVCIYSCSIVPWEVDSGTERNLGVGSPAILLVSEQDLFVLMCRHWKILLQQTRLLDLRKRWLTRLSLRLHNAINKYQLYCCLSVSFLFYPLALCCLCDQPQYSSVCEMNCDCPTLPQHT